MSNTWIEHVKQYASKNGVSYTVALKQAGASYKKAVKVTVPVNPEKPLKRAKAEKPLKLEKEKKPRKSKVKEPEVEAEDKE